MIISTNQNKKYWGNLNGGDWDRKMMMNMDLGPYRVISQLKYYI